jgi:transposase-like protein
VGCFEQDFDARIAYLHRPIAHRKGARTTNLLERLFGEERRRTKTIPHASGERAVLKLMYAALGASDSWRGVRITEFELRQLRALRKDLKRTHAERIKPVAASATAKRPAKVSIKKGT